MEIADYERATREWGRRNPEFIREDVLNPKKVKVMKTPVVTNATTNVVMEGYKCSFCAREFEKERSVGVHESQCRKNPDAHQWARGKARRRRGAQPGNHNRKKKQPVETIQAIPETIHPDSETISNSVETTVLQAEIPHTVGQPAPVKSFATNRLYDYLLAGILLAILFCGVIYAALGIKLLFGL